MSAAVRPLAHFPAPAAPKAKPKRGVYIDYDDFGVPLVVAYNAAGEPVAPPFQVEPGLAVEQVRRAAERLLELTDPVKLRLLGSVLTFLAGARVAAVVGAAVLGPPAA